MIKPPASSPFAMRSQTYVDNRLTVIPIAPGTKKPGEFTGGEWRGMNDWNRFFTRSPTELEIDRWQSWPEAGIGLLCGKLSGIIAVDVDTDDKFMLRAIASVLPPSPVRKKGKKGYTAFYRYGNQSPRSWDVNKVRIVDLLSDGRQTLMPGTQHPDGMSYVYLTDDTLEEFNLAQLPELPKNFEDSLDRVLGSMQTPEDKAARRERPKPREEDPNTVLIQSIAAQLWKQVNQQALARLDEWVPLMIPGYQVRGNGYRCCAFWRGATNPNVGIHHTGITDFGGGIGLTPIDLVMFATNTNFSQASEALRKVLGIGGDEFSMTVNAKEAAPNPDQPAVDLSAILAAPRPATKPAAPVLMPRADADPMVAVWRESEEEKEKAAADAIMDVPSFIANAPGMIGQIADWINATAPKPQPAFAVAAALVIAATVMGRRFCTNQRNFPSLFFVMIAKSAEGKDHPQKCVRRVLDAAGLTKQIGGSGYTSPGAIYSELLRVPSHVAIIDEIGQLLKSSGKQGSHNTDGALAKLLEVFSSCDDQLAPPTYSTMSMSKKDQAAVESKVVYNPAVTLLGATTPEVFFAALQDDHVSGGFLGRFILIQSHLPRRESCYPEPQEPPEAVIDWCTSLVAEHTAHADMADMMAPGVRAVPVGMVFAPECIMMLREFERELNRRMDAIENGQDAVLLGRTKEKAQRLAMIVAKATNAPRDNVIKRDALEWAIQYVRYYDLETLTSVETKRPKSKMDAHFAKMNDVFSNMKKYKSAEFAKVLATGAMPHSLLIRKMRLDKHEMRLVVETAIEAGFLFKQEGVPEIGYGGTVYFQRAAPG